MRRRLMQPIVQTPDGVMRFRANPLVDYLYDFARRRGCGMNELYNVSATQEEREQFAQLIGYSVSGFGDLSYASPKTVARADKKVLKLLKKGKKK